MDGGGEATGSGPAVGVPAVAGGGAAGSAGAGGTVQQSMRSYRENRALTTSYQRFFGALRLAHLWMQVFFFAPFDKIIICKMNVKAMDRLHPN